MNPNIQFARMIKDAVVTTLTTVGVLVIGGGDAWHLIGGLGLIYVAVFVCVGYRIDYPKRRPIGIF